MQNKGSIGAKKMVCNNCFHPLVGFKDEKGFVRVRCPNCGTITTANAKSRRIVQMELIAPGGARSNMVKIQKIKYPYERYLGGLKQ